MQCSFACGNLKWSLWFSLIFLSSQRYFSVVEKQNILKTKEKRERIQNQRQTMQNIYSFYIDFLNWQYKSLRTFCHSPIPPRPTKEAMSAT